jgi:hypothetical protein
VGKRSVAELDNWRGKGNWMLKAGKIPGANGGDVAVFPFMKRTTGPRNCHDFEDLRVSVKRALKQVMPAVSKKIRTRVLRNMAVVEVDGRNYYGEYMMQTVLGL